MRHWDDRLKRWFTGAGLLMVCALAWACVPPPESPVALSEPGEAAYDPRLIGTWYYSESEAGGFMSFTVEPIPGEAKVRVVGVAVETGREGGENSVLWVEAEAFPSNVGDATYWNVKRIAGRGLDYSPPGERPGYILYRVELLDDNHLAVLYMDDAPHYGLTTLYNESRPLRDFLSANHIDFHEAQCTETAQAQGACVPYVVLDLTQSQLRKLVEQAPSEKLFSGKLRFKKMERTK